VPAAAILFLTFHRSTLAKSKHGASGFMCRKRISCLADLGDGLDLVEDKALEIQCFFESHWTPDIWATFIR
jgi:hypothetical protein